ncbi:phospholipase D/nuclease [Acaromyces ingoldii]|uniref:Phospholipase n=1 Tax=Acaromyces ingoldii TaxID=215250 RepID=A0A316YCR6_9BASI|nr:phospholipase D/nuclease [Acaromyces ingoldii]PWN86991.1 phospholipase D/nuclease [Acaromyces ingoldii]
MKRMKVSVETTLNPNHRHDEAHEKEQDAMRQAICDSHRFRSFANIRSGNAAKWYSDGHDYFWALSEILEGARDCIYILDWWLSPELYLRRPPAHYEEYRLDRLLLKKAKEGVQIRIVVYKEVTQTMTMSSAHTKHHLEQMHPNIQVFRHPDHLGGEQTYFWSHHSKVVCVDNTTACIGGLDICYGRWDTQLHPLSDVHPRETLERTLFPGQDYNNARVQDFQKVDDFMSNQQSSLRVGRMPWHDVHISLHGPAALDVAHLFVERWNFVCELKYSGDKQYQLLAFPHGAPSLEEVHPIHDAIARHPYTARFHSTGQLFRHPWHAEKRDDSEAATRGHTMDIQVIRTCADWSNGTLPEKSIQNAYIEMIREASHCIYIENQFFITATEPGTPVVNLIGAALVERILSAAKDGRKFKVIVVIPTIPCFAGELDEAAGIRCIMAYQYRSIARRGKSILEQLEAAGVDGHEYISFYNLRGIDRINWAGVRRMEKETGVSFHEVQIAAARIYLGEQGYAAGNQTVAIKTADDADDAKRDSEGKKDPKTIARIAMPKTVDEAMDVIRRFQAAASRDDENRVKDSIADCTLHGQRPIDEEHWPQDIEDEREAFVTEEVYVHSKLMIVDDRKVLIGSANINDRSQKGDGDSETACVIEDTDLFESVMNGEKYMASRFAASFRRHLWRQHLGLVAPQYCSPESAATYPTEAMRPAPHGNPDPEKMAAAEGASTQEREWERLVADPLSDEVERMWKGQAKSNTEIADDIFQVVPSDKVRNWKDYNAFFVARGSRTGHVAADPAKWSTEAVRKRLAQWRGCLVEMPLHFLEEENLEKGSRGIEVNDTTLPIYL